MQRLRARPRRGESATAALVVALLTAVSVAAAVFAFTAMGASRRADTPAVLAATSFPLSAVEDEPRREAPASTPPPHEGTRITFYTTTRSLDARLYPAVRSWLALGADVVVFVDEVDPKSNDDIHDISQMRRAYPTTTLTIERTPQPRSEAGSPRLDAVMRRGEELASTPWVCLINADIVLPRDFARLPSVITSDVLVLGARHDCRFNPAIGQLPIHVDSFEALERYSMAPCWPHGVGGKDYFLYRKGFYARRGVRIPPFWIGKFVWDHWLVNATRHHAVDATPTIVVGHMSHNHYWDERRDAEMKRLRPLIKAEIASNVRESGCGNATIASCLAYQSVYDVDFQLCPAPTNVQRMDASSAGHAKYHRAVSEFRLHRVRERRLYQNLSLTGSSPPYWTRLVASGEWARLHGCPP